MPWAKIRPPKIRKVLLYLAQFACGIIALVLFRWTPMTGRGLGIYAILLVVLAAVILIITPRHEGYWPGPPSS